MQRLVKNTTGATGVSQAPVEPYLPISSSLASLAGLDIQASPDASATFFSKTVGLSTENIWLISALVFLSMSVAIVCALQETVFRSRNELGTLRTIGMSSRRLSRNVVLVATSLSFLASVAGLLVGWGILNLVAMFSHIEIGFYAVDPRSALLDASLASVLAVTLSGLAAAAFASLRFRQPEAVYALTLPYVECDLGDFDE